VSRCKGHRMSKPVLVHTLDALGRHLHGSVSQCERFPCTKREMEFPKPCDCPRDANGVLIKEAM